MCFNCKKHILFFRILSYIGKLSRKQSERCVFWRGCFGDCAFLLHLQLRCGMMIMLHNNNLIWPRLSTGYNLPMLIWFCSWGRDLDRWDHRRDPLQGQDGHGMDGQRRRRYRVFHDKRRRRDHLRFREIIGRDKRTALKAHTAWDHSSKGILYDSVAVRNIYVYDTAANGLWKHEFL